MNNKNLFLLNGAQQTLRVTALLLLICGLLFPLAITGVSAIFFPHQASGSPVSVGETVYGMRYVGQEFHEDYYLHGRPSAYHYNTYYENADGTQAYYDGSEFGGVASGSQNLASSNPALSERIDGDLDSFVEKNPTVRQADIPTELILASGSGLDPHISPESAEAQIPRIVAASGLSKEVVCDIIDENTSGRSLGIFGEKTVNVLEVNIAISQAMNER